MDEELNLNDFAEKVLHLIKGMKLNPTVFGVAMTLRKDEFDRLAKECLAKYHFPQNKPELITETKAEVDGTQWYIQIGKEFTPESTHNE